MILCSLYDATVRILVVEDDEIIGEQLERSLKKEGFVVDWCVDGEQGFYSAQINAYGVILLDLMLPKMDGWEVCQKLRREGVTTPILILTARDQISDKVRGLDGGADDYLPKPFDFAELMARIRALLRREKSEKSNVIHIADIEIDTSFKRVTRVSEEIHLTPREYSLLEALARNRGRTLTREMIVESIWADDQSLSNTVNFHVTSLRKKIDAGREQSLIETIHGFGYRLRGVE